MRPVNWPSEPTALCRVLAVLGLLALPAAPAAADAGRPDGQEPRGRTASLAPSGAAPASAPAEPEPAPAEPQQSQQSQQPSSDMTDFAEATMDAMVVSKGAPRFVLNLFGQTSFFFTVPEPPGQHASFALGGLDFLVTAQLGSFLFTGEYVFELDEETFETDVDVERVQIQWRRDNFWIGAGRFHTEVGYWNNAYHHGLFLQLPIDRPRALRFEDDGGLIPAHWVGLVSALEGRVGSGTLRVVAGVANTRGVTQDQVRAVADTTGAKAGNLKLELIGVGLPGLRLGVSGVYDVISGQPAAIRPALPDEDIREIIGNAFLAYAGVHFTLILEGYVFDHNADSRRVTSYDGLAVAGYRVGSVTPYVEVDYLDVPANEPYFATAPPKSTLLVGGLRWDVNDWSAIKLEYGADLPSQGDKTHTIAANWSFGI